jgi:hypothetical protein
MGSSPNGILAYGYALGGADGWNIREVDEYNGIDPDKVTWYDEDDDDFVTQAEKRLLVASGFTETDWQAEGYFDRKREAVARVGVEFRYHGNHDYLRHSLVTKTITVEWGDAKVLDLSALLAESAEHGWDDKLAAALTALGITPTQEKPGWLLCTYYG